MKNGMALVMRSKTKNDDGDVLGDDVCFFSLVDLGLFRTVYLLHVLCIYIYIYTVFIYVFLGWVGGWG